MSIKVIPSVISRTIHSHHALHPFQYLLILLIIIILHHSVGSMAFVRAFHSDPPMRPLFPRYYHLQNDELLGSWFFLFAIIPGAVYHAVLFSLHCIDSLDVMYNMMIRIMMMMIVFVYCMDCMDGFTGMPYCLIFLREQRYRSLAFGILFIMSIVATVACYMFVLACYPSDNTQVLMVMMM